MCAVVDRVLQLTVVSATPGVLQVCKQFREVFLKHPHLSRTAVPAKFHKRNFLEQPADIGQ